MGPPVVGTGVVAGGGGDNRGAEAEALRELQAMPRSGNIREPRNVLGRLIILNEECITLEDVKAYCGEG